MKHSIYLKYLIGYLVFSVLMILGINYIVEPVIKDIEVKQLGESIYKEAYSLSQKYGKYNYDFSSNSSETMDEISTIAFSTDSIIWIVDSEGKIINTSENYMVSLFIDDLGEYFETSRYVIGDFHGLLPSQYVSTIAPIVNNFQIFGYVIINKDINYAEVAATTTMNYIYIISYMILVLSLVMVLIFAFTTYLPIKKIINATKEYSKGNFDYDGLKIKSHDELGVLASNINYMANEIKTIDDKQKKFIANCSHDFRSPLTSIKGYLEAMLDGTIPPEMYEKYLNIVLTEAERLNSLTASLLTINTWNSSGQALDLSDFDIIAVVRKTILSFEGQCSKKKITMDVTYGDKAYSVYADQVKIQQVLYNLIDNAIKFSEANSTIYVKVTDKNDKIFVSVKDTGCGIPKDAITKIWHRFYKLDTSRGKDKTGSGLGLSIVKEIITSHNENINVISTEGVGSEFVFTLQRSKKSLLPTITS